MSVILPIFNEHQTSETIVNELPSLGDLDELEILFVDDDFSDGTADQVRRLAHQHPVIRLIRRVGRAGLSSAIKEGILDATGDLVVVMDCDGQHEPSTVAQAVSCLLQTGADLVIGGRSAAEIHGLSDRRERNSTWANATARFSLPRYRQLADDMSGFFAVRPEVVLCPATIR